MLYEHIDISGMFLYYIILEIGLFVHYNCDILEYYVR